MVTLENIQSFPYISNVRHSKAPVWAFYGEFTDDSNAASAPLFFYISKDGNLISDNEQLSVVAERQHVSREEMAEIKGRIDNEHYRYAKIAQNPTYIELQAVIENDETFGEALCDFFDLAKKYNSELISKVKKGE